MFKTKYGYHLLIGLLVVLGLFLGNYKNISAENKIEPVVQTSKTPNGTSITINLPNGYSGKVITTYDGKEFKTTTLPITAEEIKKINDQMLERQKAIQKIFEEQQKMFDLMWKNFWL